MAHDCNLRPADVDALQLSDFWLLVSMSEKQLRAAAAANQQRGGRNGQQH